VAGERRVTAALALPRAARLLAIERLRLVADRPLSLQRSFLPAHLGDQVVLADLAVTPLAQILRFKLGVTVTRAREAVSAVRLGRREARELAARAGAAAFESERVSYDESGAPVVFDRVFIPGDRFRITRELAYDADRRQIDDAPHSLEGARA
jgi:GntR family transcriptional regulator